MDEREAFREEFVDIATGEGISPDYAENYWR